MFCLQEMLRAMSPHAHMQGPACSVGQEARSVDGVIALWLDIACNVVVGRVPTDVDTVRHSLSIVCIHCTHLGCSQCLFFYGVGSRTCRIAPLSKSFSNVVKNCCFSWCVPAFPLHCMLFSVVECMAIPFVH